MSNVINKVKRKRRTKSEMVVFRQKQRMAKIGDFPRRKGEHKNKHLIKLLEQGIIPTLSNVDIETEMKTNNKTRIQATKKINTQNYKLYEIKLKLLSKLPIKEKNKLRKQVDKLEELAQNKLIKNKKSQEKRKQTKLLKTKAENRKQKELTRIGQPIIIEGFTRIIKWPKNAEYAAIPYGVFYNAELKRNIKYKLSIEIVGETININGDSYSIFTSRTTIKQWKSFSFWFASNILHKILHDYDFDDLREDGRYEYKITFIPIPRKDKPPRRIKQGEMNCYISQCMELPSAKQHLKFLNEYNDKIYEEGVNIEDIKTINDKLRINCILYDVLGDVWWADKRHENQRTLTLTCSNNHVQNFIDTKTFTNQYHENQYKLCDAYHSSKSSYKTLRVNQYNELTKFTDNEKNHLLISDVFVNKKDFKRNQNKITTEQSITGRIYNTYIKDKVEQLPEDIQKFTECSNIHRGMWKKPNITADNVVDHYDQINAYAQYKKSEYYNKYKLPCAPCHFYKTAHIDQDLILDTTGFSQIQNVKLSNEYLQKTYYLQNNGVYTHLILQFLKSKGCTFDIVASAWNAKKQDINFTPTEINGFKLPKKYNKEYQKLIGKLIMKKPFTQTIETLCDAEAQHLLFTLSENLTNYRLYEGSHLVQYEIENTKPSAYYIHSYLLDYQQIEFLKITMNIPFHQIIALNVDSIFTSCKIETPDVNKWRKETNHKLNHLLPIDTADFNHLKYEDEILPLPTFYNQPELLFKKSIIYITGAGGTGKSHGIKSSPLYNMAVSCPTHELRENFKDTTNNTYHSMFDVGVAFPKNEYKKYSNHILDEATMIPKNDFENIISKVSGCVVVLYDAHQCTGKFKPANYKPDITLTKNHRNTSKEENEILNYIRGKKLTEEDIEKVVGNNYIKLEDLPNEYKQGEFIIASTHKNIDGIHDVLGATIADYKNVPVKFKKPSKEYPVSRKIYNVSPDIQKKYELSIGNTIHSFQGKTINTKYYVYIDNMVWSDGLFYTAISRGKSLSQIKFII